MRLDKLVIDRNKPAHLGWWAAEFNVSEQALLAAIDAVGERADAVRNYLYGQGRPTADQPSAVTIDLARSKKRRPSVHFLNRLFRHSYETNGRTTAL